MTEQDALALDELISNPDVIISEMAQSVKDLKSDLDKGLITTSEYNELMGDVTDWKTIEELADNIERKATVEEAAKMIATII